ncbi:unnamed protein product, partial [Phaeothamnion confervicola]
MLLTDAIMIGRLLGTDALAAASVANTIFNFLWFFILGASTALDTLASQSWGAGDSAGVVLWTATTGVVLTAVLVPCSIILYFSNDISHAWMGQPEDIAADVGTFNRMLILGMPALVWSTALQKALIARNDVVTPTALCVITAFLNVGLNLAFIPWLGFQGAPIATTASRWVLFAFTAAYWYIRRAALFAGKLRWTVGNVLQLATSWRMVRAFSLIGIPGALMLGLEAASFDLTTAFAARLGTVAVDAHTSMLNIVTFSFISLPFGLAIAVSIRVGNLLGSGQPLRARLAGRLSICVGTAFMAVSAIIIVVCRQYLGAIFVDDQDVMALVAKIAPIAAAFEICDGLQGTAAGVLRGLGKQHLLVVINIIGLWLIGMTAGVCLTFVADVGLAGLWWGLFAGLSTTAAMSLFVLGRTNWAAESVKAIDRVEDHTSHRAGAAVVDATVAG